MMGLGHETDSKSLTHAVLDGVAFAFRDSLVACRMREQGSARDGGGGGTKSELWLRIIATALGIPVDLPAAGDVGGLLARRDWTDAATGAPTSRSVPDLKLQDIQPKERQGLRMRMPTDVTENLSSDQGDQPLMTKFYSITDPIKYEGPDSRNAWLSLLQSETEGHGQDHGRAPALCSVLLAYLVLAGTDPFGGETSTGNGTIRRSMAAARMKAT